MPRHDYTMNVDVDTNRLLKNLLSTAENVGEAYEKALHDALNSATAKSNRNNYSGLFGNFLKEAKEAGKDTQKQLDVISKFVGQYNTLYRIQKESTKANLYAGLSVGDIEKIIDENKELYEIQKKLIELQANRAQSPYKDKLKQDTKQEYEDLKKTYKLSADESKKYISSIQDYIKEQGKAKDVTKTTINQYSKLIAFYEKINSLKEIGGVEITKGSKEELIRQQMLLSVISEIQKVESQNNSVLKDYRKTLNSTIKDTFKDKGSLGIGSDFDSRNIHGVNDAVEVYAAKIKAQLEAEFNQLLIKAIPSVEKIAETAMAGFGGGGLTPEQIQKITDAISELGNKLDDLKKSFESISDSDSFKTIGENVQLLSDNLNELKETTKTINTSFDGLDQVITKFNEIISAYEELKSKADQKPIKVVEEIPSSAPVVKGDTITGKAYHAVGKFAKWKENDTTFDFSKAKAAQMGLGMYVATNAEDVKNFAKSSNEIKEVELNLEKCFILTKDYISSVEDINKILNTNFTSDSSAEEILSAVRNYNRASLENSTHFREEMLKLGYQGMYVGDNLANKNIKDELVIYDEKKLDKIISFTKNEFQELKNTGTIKIEFATPGLDEAVEKIEKVREEVSSPAAPVKTDISSDGKSLQELVELYHQLGTSNGASEDLNRIADSILEIVQVEDKLNPFQMQKFAEVIRGLTFVDGDNPIQKVPYTIEQAVTAFEKLGNIQHVINETPVSTPVVQDQTTAIEQQAKAQDELEQQVRETTQAITDQQSVQEPTQSSTQIEAEISQLESLEEKVNEVTTAFDQKSNAITNEKIAMEIAAKSEVESLQSVLGKVNEVKSGLTGLAEKPIEVKVKNTSTSQSSTVSEEKAKTSEKEKQVKLENDKTQSAKEQKALYDQMRKNTSDRKASEEKQKQSEINHLLSEQKSAYKSIWDIKVKIARLNPDKNSEQIAELEKQKAQYVEIYGERSKELKTLDESKHSEAQINDLLKIRQKAVEKIAIIEAKTSEKSSASIQSYLNSQSKTVEKLLLDKNVSKYPIQYEETLKQIQEQLRIIRKLSDGKTIISDADMSQIEAAQKEITRLYGIVNDQEKLANRAKASSLSANITQYLSNNPRLNGTTYEAELRALVETLKQVDSLSNVQLQNIVKRFGDIKTEINEAGKAGKRFVDIFNDKRLYGFAAQLANIFSFYRVVGYIRSAINTVRELDTALIDLKKTTSMTGNELNKFYYDSNKVAKQMGVTTKEIIEQSSAWSRLGFSTKETSTQMAQLSSKFSSISPGMNTDQSQSGLVSIMKAWDISTEDAEREIMDNINTLGNKFAETNLDIVEGMQRSAAAMAAIGEDWRSSFAIFTGGQEIVQNAEKMGTAMRSFSLRIRGYSESSEDDALELDEDLKTITGDLVDLTKTAEHAEGISIFKEGSTTEFKSLVEYLGEVSDIWDEMSQVQQTQFLQKAFAKTQAQAGAAIIQNFDQVRKALEEMENAAGSSDREMSIIQESIDYKLNALSQTWVGTFQELIDRGDIGKLIDLLTKLSEAIGNVVGALGVWGTAGVAGGAIFAKQNIGKMYECTFSKNKPIF